MPGNFPQLQVSCPQPVIIKRERLHANPIPAIKIGPGEAPVVDETAAFDKPLLYLECWFARFCSSGTSRGSVTRGPAQFSVRSSHCQRHPSGPESESRCDRDGHVAVLAHTSELRRDGALLAAALPRSLSATHLARSASRASAGAGACASRRRTTCSQCPMQMWPSPSADVAQPHANVRKPQRGCGSNLVVGVADCERAQQRSAEAIFAGQERDSAVEVELACWTRRWESPAALVTVRSAAAQLRGRMRFRAVPGGAGGLAKKGYGEEAMGGRASKCGLRSAGVPRSDGRGGGGGLEYRV